MQKQKRTSNHLLLLVLTVLKLIVQQRAPLKDEDSLEFD
jgi:hypothetical protein